MGWCIRMANWPQAEVKLALAFCHNHGVANVEWFVYIAISCKDQHVQAHQCDNGREVTFRAKGKWQTTKIVSQGG